MGGFLRRRALISFGEAMGGDDPFAGQPTRPLTSDDVEMFEFAASQRPPGRTPTVYDMLAMCEALKKKEPIRVMACKRWMKWLMKQNDKHLRGQWSHPWRK